MRTEFAESARTSTLMQRQDNQTGARERGTALSAAASVTGTFGGLFIREAEFSTTASLSFAQHLGNWTTYEYAF
jgi:hypothetical protein